MQDRAIVWHGGADWRFEEVSRPQIGHDEFLLRVEAVAFCGSEKDDEPPPSRI